MAAIQNLEVIVDVDISKALAKLTELQDELREVATSIEEVDAVGSDGINVRTSVDQLDNELAALAAEMEVFERTQEISIPVRLDQRQFGALRGLMRDAMGDALEGMDIADAGGIGGVGGGRDVDMRFGSPFMAPGSRAASRAGAIGAGMGQLFGTPGDDDGIWGTLNKSLGNLTDTTQDFDIRMSDLHNLLATIVPLLVVFIGALPAAITALLTLAGAALAAAAAFAVIAGLGALGAAMGPGGGMPSMEDFAEFWEDIRDSFFEAFAPLARRLAPVFRDALGGLETFFQAIADEGDALVALTDEARAFGRWATEFIPRFLRGLSGLVEAMDPILSMFGEFLTNEIINIIRGFVAATLEALPAVMALTDAIMSVLPGLVQLSIGFARVATFVVWFIGLIGNLLTLFGLLGGEAIGLVIASILALATAVALTNKLFAVFSNTIISRAVVAMANFIAVNFLGAESFFALSTAAQIATASLIAFLTIATLGAAVALSAAAIGAAQNFLGLSSSIDQASSSMRRFNNIAGRTSGPGFNPYGGSSGRGGGGATGGAAGVTINMERTGDDNKDNSDASKAAWHAGRMTGSRP